MTVNDSAEASIHSAPRTLGASVGRTGSGATGGRSSVTGAS
jgi:hypothetical protein